ncbi:MAG: M3 family oligoendopeptidase [Phycisphaeraceae bacterium]|nr:M3 family oligoendopeptidase [Phycisphaeraceae bacterium]
MSDNARRFVPDDLDAGDFDRLQPWFDQLLARPLPDVPAVQQWLDDASQLAEVISEYGSRRQIEHSCHTDDAEIEKRYMDFVEHVAPRIKPLEFRLAKKLLETPSAASLPADRHEMLLRQWRADVELYRDANVPLQTEVTKLTTQYGKLCGAMTVEFHGKTWTLQQLARFLEDPDRSLRQEAWTLSSQRRLKDRQAIDEIFDQLMTIRSRIAANADMPDYRAYVWKSHYREDYTPADCKRFGDAIAEVCLPVVGRMQRQRKQSLGVEALRPWDLSVDVLGRASLQPFPSDDALAMLGGVGSIFQRLSPELGSMFGQMKPGRNLDLDSRLGKRPGGFQSSLEVVKEPFIFMNAAGLHHDVETMLHEAGHAFHYMDARSIPLVFLRHAPLEFCEVASMSMELLGSGHLDVFYNEQDAGRARRKQMESIVGLLPWIATIDGFQHWLYENPNHTSARRTQAWESIFSRFSSHEVDWTGCEDARAARWHAQLHIFHYPFYYVEYGIAQLGALQVWQQFRKDPRDAIRKLRRAFALGGTRPLPELFDAAGIRFDFSAATLEPLMQMVRDELEQLPV